MAVELQVSNQAADDATHGLSGGDAVSLVVRAARAVLRDQGVEEGELSITLVDDAVMATLNRQWKGGTGPTDVLSFALHDEGEPLVGDVYLGVDRAVEQAAELGETPGRELSRLAIHGTLHVLGWDHPDEGREDSDMWRHQERILGELGVG